MSEPIKSIMKRFIILNVLLLSNLVISDNSGSNNSKPSYDELERQLVELKLENGKLLKNVGELQIENANLLTELLAVKAKENQHSKENELTFLNCSGLASDIEYVSSSLTTLTNEIQTIKPLIQERVTAFGQKFGFIESKPEEKTARCDCFPLNTDDKIFEIACSAKKSNGTWTVIQRRMDGKISFYRPWAEYRIGFGNRTGEFFIGLDNLHRLTSCAQQELRIDMVDGDNQKRYAEYNLVEIGDASESFALKKLGTYSGDAGDSLRLHVPHKFSTYDRDNDGSDSNHCAVRFKGAWWHNNCHHSNLNGEYENVRFGEGINWYAFRGHTHSMKFVEIKIRPKNN